jgi:hypothetical protein
VLHDAGVDVELAAELGFLLGVEVHVAPQASAVAPPTGQRLQRVRDEGVVQASAHDV